MYIDLFGCSLDYFQNKNLPCLSQASIAQWQSTGLVNQGSRVQSSLEAFLLHLLTHFTAYEAFYINF